MFSFFEFYTRFMLMRGNGKGIPPVRASLLAWLTGSSTSTIKKDSWRKPYAENMTMSGSSCVTLNGVDEFGTTSTDHGTIVSSSGTAVLTYDGTTITTATVGGTAYDVTFSDGTHYRFAEGNASKVSYSDDGEHYITWTSSDLPALWAGSQDEYHGNAVSGFGYRENLVWDSNSFSDWDQNYLNAVTFASADDDYTLVTHPSETGRYFYTDIPGQGYTVDGNVASIVIMGYCSTIGDTKFSIIIDTMGTEWWVSFEAYYPDADTEHTRVLLSPIERYYGDLRIAFSSNIPDLQYYMKNVSVIKNPNRDNITQPDKVVCLGDSISTVYPIMLSYILKDSTVINSGVGGDTIQEMIDRFNTDVSAHNPTQIILMAGRNSIGQGVSLVDCKSQMAELITLCEETGAELLIGNCTPTYQAGGWDDTMQDILESFNLWLLSQGHPVIDMYTKFLQPGTTTDMMYAYTDDGTHPTYANELLAIRYAEYFGFRYPEYIKTEDFTLDGTEKLPFLNDHPGNTWNDSETTFTFEEKPVLTFNGVDEEVLLSLSSVQITSLSLSCVPTGTATATKVLYNNSVGFSESIFRLYTITDGTLVLRIRDSLGVGGEVLTAPGTIVDGTYYKINVYESGGDLHLVINDVLIGTTPQLSDQAIGVNESIGSNGLSGNEFKGIIRDVSINGTLIPLDEGEGTTIHDSNGNAVGTFVTSDAPSAWTASAPMVSQELMDAEAVQGTTYFTDGSGHGLGLTQEEITAGCNHNNQYYATMCPNKNLEYWLYKTQLSIADDDIVKIAACLPPAFNGIYKFDGTIKYDGVRV